MNEIVSFIREILMLENCEKEPVGLCGFENMQKVRKPRSVRQPRKKELRLSELMDK